MPVVDFPLADATAEEFQRLNAELLDAFRREPRSVRRAIRRDVARAYPVAPKPPQHGAVAERVNAPRQMPIRLSRRNHEARIAGVQQPMVTGERMPVSGRARRDVKRQRRADFWFRFKIAADDRADTQVLADLNARMLAVVAPAYNALLDAPQEA